MATGADKAYDNARTFNTLFKFKEMDMCKGKCTGKGKCCQAFTKAKDTPPAAPPAPPVAPPANDQKTPDAPKNKCCGGSCHPKQ